MLLIIGVSVIGVVVNAAVQYHKIIHSFQDHRYYNNRIQYTEWYYNDNNIPLYYVAGITRLLLLLPSTNCLDNGVVVA
jgi:hypothetical protein